MPRQRGRNNNWNSDFNKFRAGDDRAERRVSFKPSRNGRKNKSKDWEGTIRSHLEDEDIDMAGLSSRGGTRSAKFVETYRGKHRGRGRISSPAPGGERRRLFEDLTSWYRIRIPYGTKYTKEFILKALQQKVSPLPLTVVAWGTDDNAVVFYVDEYKVASKLHDCDKQIPTPDGYRLYINVKSGMPRMDITPELKDKMKHAMANRYNPATKALDLTKFYADPMLQEVFCVLFKPAMMLAAIDVIAENIPELEALNLQENKLYVLEHLSVLAKKLPMLKVLHIGKNKIRDVRFLDSLKGLNLVDLDLDGNPLCGRFKDRSLYVSVMRYFFLSERMRDGILLILKREPHTARTVCSLYSEVRKRFPKLLKLDGVDLPPPIGFDVSTDMPLPQSLQTYLCNAEPQSLIRQFLEQYFSIYDSDNRQPLLQAYHENALYSLTMSYRGCNPKNSFLLNWYESHCRDLLSVKDESRRYKLLRRGQLAVTSFINDMPKTKHDIMKFNVDCPFYTPQMLMLFITGVFREYGTTQKTPPMRAFSRTLLIVPAGSGYCIANEQLFVTNATREQIKDAFQTPLEPPLAPIVTTEVALAPVAGPDDDIKQQMVLAMAQHSGMNLDWSKKCLEETNWDYQKATYVFNEFQKAGTIPPEAFVK